MVKKQYQAVVDYLQDLEGKTFTKKHFDTIVEMCSKSVTRLRQDVKVFYCKGDAFAVWCTHHKRYEMLEYHSYKSDDKSKHGLKQDCELGSKEKLEVLNFKNKVSKDLIKAITDGLPVDSAAQQKKIEDGTKAIQDKYLTSDKGICEKSDLENAVAKGWLSTTQEQSTSVEYERVLNHFNSLSKDSKSVNVETAKVETGSGENVVDNPFEEETEEDLIEKQLNNQF